MDGPSARETIRVRVLGAGRRLTQGRLTMLGRGVRLGEERSYADLNRDRWIQSPEC